MGRLGSRNPASSSVVCWMNQKTGGHTPCRECQAARIVLRRWKCEQGACGVLRFYTDRGVKCLPT